MGTMYEMKLRTDAELLEDISTATAGGTYYYPSYHGHAVVGAGSKHLHQAQQQPDSNILRGTLQLEDPDDLFRFILGKSFIYMKGFQARLVHKIESP